MKYYTKIGDVEREYRFERRGPALRAHVDGQIHDLDLSMIGDGTAFSLLVDGHSHDLIVERSDGGLVVQFQGERVVVEVLDERERTARSVAVAKGGGAEQIAAVMPGVVVDVRVAEGDTVEEGQTLVVLEAMKMQNPLRTERAGVVVRVLVENGQTVAGGDLLVEIEGG